MGGDVVVFYTQLVRVNGLQSGLDFSQSPLRFLFKESGDIGVEDFGVGEREEDVKILVLDDLVLDQSGFKSVLGVDLTELCEVLQS